MILEDPLTPGVSVVMSLHNAADRVEEGVRSVQGQSLSGWELLVVDRPKRGLDRPKRGQIYFPRHGCGGPEE